MNPERKIHPGVVTMTGLTNELLRNEPTFAQKANFILHFLNELTKPVCLVAHNGNTFDYKILLAECNDVRIPLPDDLLCVDTLAGFRKILKQNSELENSPKDYFDGDLISDENMWPELNVSLEDWQEIDDVCTFLTKVSCAENKFISDESLAKQAKNNNESNEHYTTKENIQENNNQNLTQKRCDMIEKIFGDSIKSGKNKKTKTSDKPRSITNAKNNGTRAKKGEFTLSALYKRILNKDFVNAHRAEGDCFALLECVTAMKDNFLPWMDNACKKLTEITPLIRY